MHDAVIYTSGALTAYVGYYFSEELKAFYLRRKLSIIARQHIKNLFKTVFSETVHIELYSYLLVFNDWIENELSHSAGNEGQKYFLNYHLLRQEIYQKIVESAKDQELKILLAEVKNQWFKKYPQSVLKRDIDNFIKALDEDKFILSNIEATHLGEKFLENFLEFKNHLRRVLSFIELTLHNGDQDQEISEDTPFIELAKTVYCFNKLAIKLNVYSGKV